MAKVLELGIKLSMLMNGNYQAGLTRASKLITDLTKKTQGLGKQSQLINKYREANTSLLDITKKLNNNGWSDTGLLRQFDRQEQTVAKYRRELEAANIDITKLDSHERSLGYTLDNQSSKLERIRNAQAKYNSIREQLFNWNNVKGDFITSAALVKVFDKPIKVAADFESAMARVKAAGFVKADADLSGLEALRKQALQLGRDTKFTAVEAAATQENLIRGGMSAKQTIAAMPGVMAMAASENIDLAQSANMIVSTLSALELPAELSQRVADVFANMSVSAKANISTIYESVNKMAGMGTTLKIPLEHMAALAAAGQMKGVDASTVGTGIKTGLARLSKPAAEAQKALNQIGLAIKDKQGNFRQIDDLLADLYNRLQKFGSVDQAGIMSAIFGKQNVDVWMKLASAAGKQLEDGQTLLNKYINSNYTEADGITIKMQNINLDTYNGQLALLSSAWEGLQQKIGNAIAPINRYIVEVLSKGINSITEFMNKHSALADVLVKVAYVAAGLKIFMTVYKYAKLTVGLVSSFLELRAAIEGVGLFAKAATAAQWLWNAALNANPIGLAITAVAGLITLGILLYKNWDSIKALGTSMWAYIQQKAQEFNDWWESWTLADVFAPIVQYAWQVWEDIKAPFIAMKEWIKDLFANLNPFNWELPSWLGGGKAGDNQVRNAESAGVFIPPSIPAGRKRALGGMITRPEIALIGEAGPEAIIPLSAGKKTRGLQVLSMAAESLGVNLMPSENKTLTTHVNNSRISTLNRSLSYANVNQDNLYEGANNLLTQSEIRPFTNNETNTNDSTISKSLNPVINITVNNSGSASESEAQTLATNIYERVKEALNEIINNEARLSYA